ncbi:MAG TPA: hypothetical protein VHT68_26025 [Pseudolabrys sp.]|jgi:hypothetical protein|nr:hypothetical protein [Pseudolabrys sp.]
MTDVQFAISGKWALASDGNQWILQRRRGGRWDAVSFVRSTRDILARCMREKGATPSDIQSLLDGLPGTFDAWQKPTGVCHSDLSASGDPPATPAQEVAA